MEFFNPQCADDLAIHAKKLTEVTNWFLHCDSVKNKAPAQICLITGPSGCGKTATIKVLAKENNYNIQEWINPVDCEIVQNLGDQNQGNSYVGSQLDAFKSFLFRASRFKSLFDASNKRLLLVEDFPNVLLNDPTCFESILE